MTSFLYDFDNWWLAIVNKHTGKSEPFRKYNIEDITSFLGICKNCRKSLYGTDKKIENRHCYSDEFQQWFASGIRHCHKHAYPFYWHIMQSATCRQCDETGVEYKKKA